MSTEGSPSLGQQRSRARTARRVMLGLLLLLVTGGAVAWWLGKTRVEQPGKGDEAAAPFQDPRLAYKGPLRNVHPDVKYVGDETCVDCHREIHDSYRQHPMGRSLVPISELAGDQPYDSEHNNPFTEFGLRFKVDREGDRVFHRQSQLDDEGKAICDFAHEVDYAVGSGARGHSYLTVRDGYVMQTPVSWFTEKEMWGLSPGFARAACAGRRVTAECLYCHTNRVEPVEGTHNRYEEPVFHGHAIGCERCHGPGELHVQSSAKDDIVNPARLEPELREAVCQQCHLEGATRVLRRGRELNDFRPGLSLAEFWSIYIRGAGQDDHKAVNHVEQMYESLCFQRSPRSELGCITCHDPHTKLPAEQRVEHYRDNCLRCHQRLGCSLAEAERREQQPDDSCIACHMPRAETSDIAHVAATDHRIVRNAGEEPTNRRGNRPKAPLLDFYRGAPDVQDLEQGRDLSVALYQMSLRGMPLTDADADFVVGLLNRALEDWAGDLRAWEAKGKILQIVQRHDGAIAAFEELLQRSPQHEGALVTLGQIHRDLEHREAAIEYWQRAVEVNPHFAEYRKNLALLLAAQQDWDQLRPHVEKWLELDPSNPQARQLWIECLLDAKRSDEAAAEFEKLRAMKPQQLPELEAWFKERTGRQE